jgi:hypothetical protein
MELQKVTRDEAEAHVKAGGGAFFLMDQTGDTKTIWDPTRPEEVEVAQAQFDALTNPPAGKQKYSAFRVGEDGEKSTVKMTEFDPKAGKIIFAPLLVKG